MSSTEGTSLRTWAGSLSPAWQAVVPGAFAWAATVVRPARAVASSWPMVLAVLALVSLLSGPALERRLPRDQGRLLAFWGFVLGSLGSLGSAGVPGPMDTFEALVGVLSWVLFAVTVAAPALGAESRGLQGRADSSLSPRRTHTRRMWPYFAMAIATSLVAFTCALAEPNRERATAFALLAALASLAVFAALGNQVRVEKGKRRLRVPVILSLVALLVLTAGVVVAWQTWRERSHDDVPAAKAP